MVIKANEIWADGPSGAPFHPYKPDLRTWGTWIESIIGAFFSTGGKIYQTRALLNADLTPAANSMAWVMEDPTVANNGVYRKVGATGTGSWVRAGDLPFSFIVASNSGLGTPNAIQATTSIPVSSSALVILPIAATNTASPVTVSFNGGPALIVKTNGGNDIVSEGLISGMIAFGYVSGSTFRLASDQASAAFLEIVQAAAGAAVQANISAQEAKDLAAGYASDASAVAGIPIYSTISGMSGISVPEGALTIKVNGRNSYNDGQGGDFARQSSEPLSGDYFKSADGSWWLRINPPTATDLNSGQMLRSRALDGSAVQEISVATLLSRNKERRKVFTSSSAGAIVVVDAADFEAFHVNDSNGIITFDVSTCELGRPYTFVNGGGATVSRLDPGAASAFPGFSVAGTMLEFSAREACTIVRQTSTSYRIISMVRVPVTGVDSSRQYWELPNGTFEYRGRTSLAASSTTLIQLPVVFGGQPDTNLLFVVHSLTKSGTAGVTASAPIRVRGSDTAGTVGTTGPQIAIYNPNATAYEIEFIISNLTKTS